MMLSVSVMRRRAAPNALMVCLLCGCGGTDGASKATNVAGSGGAAGGGFVDAAADGSVEPDAGEAGVCAPKSCAQLGVHCGSVLDGCGATIHCGACPDGQTCGAAGPNLCGAGTCAPKTCAQLGASCGSISDGCSEVLACGQCSPGEVCGGGGIPNQCACVPTLSCVSAQAQCGPIEDGCGNTLQCGSCASPLVCEDNVCVCHPSTCDDYHADCGLLPDGCGGELSCGSCDAGEVCGGGGTNRCGPEPCTPFKCSDFGYDCGTLDDGCGGSINCGSCSGTDSCGGAGTYGVCGCTPLDCDAYGLCAASSLNPQSTHDESDGCDSVLACGKCCKSGTFCASWGQTVEWQCGCGDPGEGWVSQGQDCYHHDTGSACS